MSDSESELERTYTVPLSRAWIAPRYRRTSRAVNVLKEFARRHMKSSEIKIDSDLNEKLWSRGITKPPRRIMVKMSKDEDGLVTISLPEEEQEEIPTENDSAKEKGENEKENTSSEIATADKGNPSVSPSPSSSNEVAKQGEKPTKVTKRQKKSS